MKHIDRESRPPGNSSRLHTIEFETLRDFVHSQTGIYFHDNKRHVLQARVMTRLEALFMNYFEDYVEFICNPANINEGLRLIDAITSTESSFFRTPAQFTCIENQVLPSLSEDALQNKRNQIKIWSAACATGEEAFSLAMIIEAVTQSQYPLIQFEIVGSDVNTEALYRAECGRFQGKAIQSIPAAFYTRFYNRCFTASAAGHKLIEPILDRVTFKRINLTDRTDMMRMHGVDLVLCCNVLTSFSQEARQKTIRAIYNSMNDGGYLIIGAEETLFGLSHPFLEININGIRVYQKCT